MITALIIGGIAAGAVLLGAAGSTAGAVTLFKRIIPRQDGVKVDLSEMADAEKWERYKTVIYPNKEYMLSLPMEHVTIKSKDGLTLHGDYIPAETQTDKIALCFHGYTSNGMGNCSSVASFLHKEGVDCLIVDNRAHGMSEGKYIGFGILDRYDCLSWLNYVNSRFGDDKQLILFGTSMGGSTVLMAAGLPDFPKNVKAIIADCAFTSPEEVFTHVLKRDYKLPKFPIMNINNVICKKKAGYGFSDCSTIDAVSKTTCPVLFIHGKEDTFVPPWMSERNYEACASPKELLMMENAGHGGSYYENPELYEKTAKAFLDKHLK